MSALGGERALTPKSCFAGQALSNFTLFEEVAHHFDDVVAPTELDLGVGTRPAGPDNSVFEAENDVRMGL